MEKEKDTLEGGISKIKKDFLPLIYHHSSYFGYLFLFCIAAKIGRRSFGGNCFRSMPIGGMKKVCSHKQILSEALGH